MLTMKRASLSVLPAVTIALLVALPALLGRFTDPGAGAAFAQGGNTVSLQCPVCKAPVALTPGQMICPQCGVPLLSSTSGTGKTTLTKGIAVKPTLVADTQGTGLDVVRVLVPGGWRLEGGVEWNLEDAAQPATVAFRMTSPTGVEFCELLPNMTFYWNQGEVQAGLIQVGGRSLSGMVVPPMDALDTLKRVALPSFRGNYRDLRITREERLPQLPAQLGMKPVEGGFVDAAKVRATYTDNGLPVEEEFLGIIIGFNLPGSFLNPGGSTMWSAPITCSMRARGGRLDAASDLYRTIGSSLRANPSWQKVHDAIKTALCQGQIQRTRAIGKIGSDYARSMGVTRESDLKDWYGRQAIYDGIAERASQTIRGVDAYYDPVKGETVELPGGYGHAWTNDLGEYIVTESPSFNPGIGSNLHWQPLQFQH